MRSTLFVAAMGAIPLVACGAGDESTGDGSGSAGASATSTGGSAGAMAAGGTPGTVGSAFGSGGQAGSLMLGGTGGSMGGTGGEMGEGCAETPYEPEEITKEVEMEIEEAQPVALYLMVDRSGSMGLTGLWGVAANAITQFVNDPSSAGLDVAAQYFPTGQECNAGTYASPFVGLGRLPGHAQAIIDSLGANMPAFGDTPMQPALDGALQFCRSFKQDPSRMPPDEDCAVVLITDGMPDLCGSGVPINDLASSAWMNDGIRTYTVGMDGADFTVLNGIASAGGTDCTPSGPGNACNATSGSAGLSAALEQIRSTVTRTVTRTVTERVPLECEWGLPSVPEGETLDPDKINVDLVADGQKIRLGAVPSEADCPDFVNGWYYDDPDDPTTLHACPDTCETVKQDNVVGVNVTVGCKTEPAEPPR